VQIIHQIENWMLVVLFWGLLAFRVWALVDCLIRKAPAFPAANKLTKPTWVLLTALSAALGALLQSPINLLSYISLIVSAVYMADVRPAVREISGPSRW
jgi:predicted cobalt transporter CbtA